MRHLSSFFFFFFKKKFLKVVVLDKQVGPSTPIYGAQSLLDIYLDNTSHHFHSFILCHVRHSSFFLYSFLFLILEGCCIGQTSRFINLWGYSVLEIYLDR